VNEADAPAYDPAARYAIREGMELALIRSIQQLPGRQRAVLIFRDVLGWTAPEVAELLEATVASVNSALQRARATVADDLPAAPAPAVHDGDERMLLGRYIDAFERDDVDALIALLREDALLRMPPQPSVVGAVAIARFFRESPAGGDLSRLLLTPTHANGRPAVVVQRRTSDGGLTPRGVLVLEIAGGRITGIDAFIEPALVAHFATPTR